MKTKTGKLLLDKRSKNIQINTLNQDSENTNKYHQSNSVYLVDKVSQRQIIQKNRPNIQKQVQSTNNNISYLQQRNSSELKVKPNLNFKIYHAHSLSYNQYLQTPSTILLQKSNSQKNPKSIYMNLEKRNNKQFSQQQCQTIDKINQTQNNCQNQRLLQLKQSLQKLQTQNYRLIQQNYLLILYYKRLLKENKQSLLKIANLMENLEQNQVIKLVYDRLGQNKQKQLQLSYFNSSVTGDKKKIQKEFLKIYDQEKKSKLKIRNQVFSQFYLSQHICKSTQMSSKKDHNDQYLQEFKRQPKNRHSMLQKLHSNPFQSVPLAEYRSQNSIQKLYNLKSNIKKNQQYSDCQQSFQYSNFDHIPYQISLNQNLPSQMNNSSMNLNMNRSQMAKDKTNQKFYGNRNQLYKMLLLQASAIQHFCFNQNYLIKQR